MAVTCLSTIQSSIQMLQTQLSLASQLQQHTERHLPSVSRFTNIIQLHTQLWHQLFFPHITKVRQHTYEVLITLETITIIFLPTLSDCRFKEPKTFTTPSIVDQIIYRPISIIDPYLLALRTNYYYPIAPADLTMTEDTQMETQLEEEPQRQLQSPKRSTSPSKHPITVESSLAAIADIIKEVEADDPPTEVEVGIRQDAPAPSKKQFTHRFAIYRKQTYPTPGAPPNQLALFKSLVKNIKVADQTAKILPIRSDIKIYSLSTTDQINALEHIG